MEVSIASENLILNPEKVFTCIQFLFIEGRPVCEAYEAFCAILGYDVMKYRDFDFWWYRIKEGKFDFDYDRSQDPKKPELYDIPLDIVEEIVTNLDWVHRSAFRKTSHACRDLVDDQPYSFNRVEFHDGFPLSYVQIDNVRYSYIYNNTQESIILSSEIVIKAPDFAKLALTDFMLTLKNPKNKIEKLCVSIKNEKIRGELHAFLQSIHHQIHVERLRFHPPDADNNWNGDMQKKVLEVLPYLKPGVLESISLKYDDFYPQKVMQIEKLARLEQWKQAKRLKTRFEIPKNVKNFENFAQVETRLNTMKVVDVIYLKKMLLKAPNFKICTILSVKCEKNIVEKLESRGFVCDDETMKFQRIGDFFRFIML